MNKQIEAEGGELVLRNKNGSVAIIPARHRQEVLDMIKDGCNNCLNDYISGLPKMKDYAGNGTLLPIKKDEEKPKNWYDKSGEPVHPLAPNIKPVAVVDSGKSTMTLTPEQIEQITKNPSSVFPGYITNSPPAESTMYRYNSVIKNLKLDEVATRKYDDDYVAPTLSSAADNFKFPTDKASIKQLQSTLVAGKYYNTYIDPSLLTDKGTIKKVQRKLGVKVDGIIGPETLSAIEANNQKEVDGIVGSRTRAAYNNYVKEHLPIKDFGTTSEKATISNMVPYITKIPNIVNTRIDYNYNKFNKETSCSTDDPECASWMFNKYSLSGINRDSVGLYGDAWTATTNIRNKGGKDIYFSGYQKPKKYPGKTQMTNIIKTSIKNNPLPVDKLQPGQVVELLNPSSSNFKKAFDTGFGGTATTHIGMIVKDDKGNIYIEHNVGGTIHQDPIDDVVQGKTHYSITRVTQPNLQPAKDQKSHYVNAENLGIKFNNRSKGHNIADENAYLFQKTIVVNREAIKQNFGLNDVEFKLVNQIAYGVAANETYFGKADLYKEKLNPTRILIANKKIIKASENNKQALRNAFTYSKVGQAWAKRQDDKDKRDRSQGWGQVKEEELFGKDFVERTGLSSVENTDTPEYSALTTVSAVAAKYKVLSSLISQLGVDVKTKEFKSLLAISHNQGFKEIKNSLELYKKTGDYNYIEKYNNFRYPSNVRLFSEEYVTFN